MDPQAAELAAEAAAFSSVPFDGTDAADAIFDAILSEHGHAHVRTIHEVLSYLIGSTEFPLDKIPEILTAIDVNGDGMIDRDEWRVGFCKVVGPNKLAARPEPHRERNNDKETRSTCDQERAMDAQAQADKEVCGSTVTVVAAPAAGVPVQTSTSAPILRCTLVKGAEPVLGIELGPSNDDAVIIVGVKANTPGARCVPPLRAGMRILAVDGSPAVSAKAAADRIKAADGKVVIDVEHAAGTGTSLAPLSSERRPRLLRSLKRRIVVV